MKYFHDDVEWIGSESGNFSSKVVKSLNMIPPAY